MNNNREYKYQNNNSTYLREISMINLEFWSIVRAYEESRYNHYLSVLRNGGPIMDYIIDGAYDRYDGAWRSYCDNFNKIDGRIVIPNEMAFELYCRENVLKTNK